MWEEGLVAIAATGVYANSLFGDFVYDDRLVKFSCSYSGVGFWRIVL